MRHIIIYNKKPCILKQIFFTLLYLNWFLDFFIKSTYNFTSSFETFKYGKRKKSKVITCLTFRKFSEIIHESLEALGSNIKG
jgi:hypothetical protein